MVRAAKDRHHGNFNGKRKSQYQYQEDRTLANKQQCQGIHLVELGSSRRDRTFYLSRIQGLDKRGLRRRVPTSDFKGKQELSLPLENEEIQELRPDNQDPTPRQPSDQKSSGSDVSTYFG